MDNLSPSSQAEEYLRKIIKLAASPAHDENKRDQIERLAQKTLDILRGVQSDAYEMGVNDGISRASVRPGAGDMGG